MQELKVTTELCAEDRARLDKIAGLLEASVAAYLKTPKTPAETPQKSTKAEPQAKTQPKAETQAQPQKTEPVSVKTEEPAPVVEEKAEPAPAVKLDAVQALVVKLATTGKKAEARDIVFQYAQKVTEIPADKYGEVYAKLKELEGAGQ